MSSKSRKKTARPAEQRTLPTAAGRAGPGGATPAEQHKSAFDIPDEILHAPKQTNKLRFALMIVLVVILLIIFLIPGEITACAGSGGRQENATIVTWEHPTHGRIALSSVEYYTQKRALDAALGIDYVLKVFTFGIGDQTLSDQDAMRLIILERLARDAGVQVTNTDLREHLQELVQRAFQGSTELYYGYAARLGGTRVVEATLRSLLRARRYLDLVGYLAEVPDPQGIEKLWAEEHVEFAFDYVELETSAFADQARQSLPGDEELATWYGELPEESRSAYLSPERRRAELATYQVGSAAPQALLDAFPRPAEESADDEAQNYYNRYYFLRFRRAEAAPGDPGEGAGEEGAGEEGAGEETAGEGEAEPAQEEAPEEALPQYLPFDEVREACLAEAPVYFALERWLRDLQTRKSSGETVDLAAEATRYGLGLRVSEAPLTLADLGPFLKDLGGSPVATMVFSTQPGELAFNVQVQPTALSVLRVLERVEPQIRPFAEVRDQVVLAWVAQQARKVAEERLSALREGLPVLAAGEEQAGEETAGEAAAAEETAAEEAEAGGEDPSASAPPARRTADEALFRSTLEAAGFQVQRRDWLDRSGAPTEDQGREQPAHVFLKSRPEYYELDQDEVAAQAVDAAGERVYLVRLAGKREIPIERMTPAVYQAYKGRTASMARMAVGQGYSQALEELYDVRFATGAEEQPEPADGAAPAE